MSHYHAEIIIPPTDDVEEAIEQVLAPFNENPPSTDDEESEWLTRHAFWDWYVIGGRWAGAKLVHGLDMEAFYAELQESEITVSNITMGKQTISPPSQMGKVDAIWRKRFPDSPFDSCPVFSNAGDRLHGDVLSLSQIDRGVVCATCIIAKPSYSDPLRLDAGYLVRRSIWNGVNHQDTMWDGTVGSALVAYDDNLTHASHEYRKDRIPTDDWLVVTVDYHS